MTVHHKARYTAQRAKGKVKEAAGQVTGNRRLEVEGKVDQIEGAVKQAAQKIVDAVQP